MKRVNEQRSSPLQQSQAVNSLPETPVLSTKKHILWLTFLFLLFVIGIGGIIFATNTETLLIARVSPTPSPIASTPTTDLTANWKLFQNAHGYQVRYPSVFNVESNSINVMKQWATSVRLFLTSSTPRPILDGPHMTILVLDDQRSVEEVANDVYTKNITHPGIPAIPLLPPTMLTFLGMPAVEFKVQNKGFISLIEEYSGYEGMYRALFLDAQSKKFMIFYTETPEFNQILSTLQFIEPPISQECGVCGPMGMHNMNNSQCAPGLECTNEGKVGNVGELRMTSSSVYFCVKPGESISKCMPR